MVVLASAITTKNGKALLSRHFVELSKVRIEGLLAAFPKLMGSDKQHTFVETENVRYIYQPLESLYVLLITNKSSNILEDLETLHLLAKIVPEYCSLLEEKEIVKRAFEIIFAFDEAIAMGYKERVNLQQIKHFTSMESHDETRFKLEEKNKMILAKKTAERQRKAIEKKRMEEKKFGVSMEDRDRHSSSSSSNYSSSKSSFVEQAVEKKESPKPEARFAKGMQLGKGKSKTGYSQVLKEENVPDIPDTHALSSGPSTQSVIPETSHEKVHITIAEKLVLSAENDGGLKNLEVKGELLVTVYENVYNRVRVHVSQGDSKEFQFKAHPNINKALYNDNVLALKDATRTYPVGTPSSILKWRYVSKDEKSIPLTINVWPSVSGGETTVPVEYEKKAPFDLSDVVISIPIPGAAPVVGECEGSCDFDSKKSVLNWRIPLIDDSNKTGSMEFTVPAADTTAFLPVDVSFKTNQTYCAIQAVAVTFDDGSNKGVDFSTDVSLSTEQYQIE